MRDFLREHWPWIVTPIVLVVLLVVLVAIFGADQVADDGVYKIW